MNYSIEKITTKSGEVRYEARIWHRGRNAKQSKKRFKTRGQASNYIESQIKAEKKKTLAGFNSRFFGEEYQYWRSENTFAPGWLANIDGYWEQSKDLLEKTKLADLEEKVSLLKKKWKDSGNSPKTVHNKLGFIYAVLNFSVEKKRIPNNPLGTLKREKFQAPDIEFWSHESAVSFLNFLDAKLPSVHPDRWMYSAVLTAINTGMRAGEIWGLRHGDLKPDLGCIRVVRQYNRVSKDFAQLKGKEARSVPLNAQLWLELNGDGKRARELVFEKNKKPVDHDVFREFFDAMVTEWGGHVITFHGLRHTAATLMLRSGVDVKTLQSIMGHKDISTTMRYVHAIGENARKVGQFFSVNPNQETVG